MDPLTLIVTAAALGAAAGLKPVAEQAVKDAYAGLKTLIQRKYKSVDLALLESDPASDARKAVVREELQKTAAPTDEELLRAAQTVVQTVEKHDPASAATVNIKLEDIKAAASVRIEELIAFGAGASVTVDAKKVEAGGDFVIKGVQAGGSEASGPN